MSFKFIDGDITKITVDAIVDSAESEPIFNSGVDAAIYGAAGSEQLLEARKKVGNIDVGEAAATPGFAIDVKYIIHTVAPLWIDGNHEELESLMSCYINSMELAKSLNCSSIAFPLIATGGAGFPQDLALTVCTTAIEDFLEENDMTIFIVIFDQNNFKLPSGLQLLLDYYIEENYIDPQVTPSYSNADDDSTYNLTTGGLQYDRSQIDSDYDDSLDRNLDNAVNTMGQKRTFSDQILCYIDESGKTDSQIYNKASVSRQTFHNLRSHRNYKPDKNTALRLAIALNLDLEQTNELLESTGYSLSPCDKFDVVVEFFIHNKIYDFEVIEAALKHYNLPNLIPDAN